MTHVKFVVYPSTKKKKKKKNYNIPSITLHANIYITCFRSNLDQVQRHGWAKRAITLRNGLLLEKEGIIWET